jgi:hypothetical protein
MQARTLYIDLLIKCVANTIYADNSMHPVQGATSSEYNATFREFGRDFPLVAHTMIGLRRLQSLRELVELAILNNIPGDLIETGVWRGGACILMRGILAAYGVTDRSVYVADSFQGFPRPDPEHYPADGTRELDKGKVLHVSRAQVADNFRAYGLLDSQVQFVEGWFKDTLPGLEVSQFAVIRLDGDLYQSTIQALDALYPRLSPGGFVIIDDYGGWRTCRQATGDYRAEHGITEPIQTIDQTGRWWQKRR